jgi:hypothetical protein
MPHIMIDFTPMETFDSTREAHFGRNGFTGCGMFLRDGDLYHPVNTCHNIIDGTISRKAKEIIVILTTSNNGKKKEIRFLDELIKEYRQQRKNNDSIEEVNHARKKVLKQNEKMMYDFFKQFEQQTNASDVVEVESKKENTKEKKVKQVATKKTKKETKPKTTKATKKKEETKNNKKEKKTKAKK